MKITAVDLRGHEDKASALRELWRLPSCYRIDVNDLLNLPRTPLAYWATRSTLKAFKAFARLGEAGRIVTSTNPINADFRYARCWWEISAKATDVWRTWAKGGPHARFYRDIDMVVAWDEARHTYRGFLGTANRPLERPASSQYFFRPGLTWSRRSQIGLSLRALPASTVFGDKGPYVGATGDDPTQLLAILAVANSTIFADLVDMQMAFGSFEVGVLQQTPFPDLPRLDQERLADLAHAGWSQRRSLDTAVEVSHSFVVPVVLQVDGADLGNRVLAWSARVTASETELKRLQAEIDELCLEHYGISEDDRGATVEGHRVADAVGEDPDDADGDADEGDEADDDAGPVASEAAVLAAGLVSWAVGVGVGRFDVRMATGERSWPGEPDPFDSLPVCSPGMLTGSDGLPLAEPPAGYPVKVSAVLVVDPGHGLDITRRVRSVFEVVFDDDADHWWSDVGLALGARGGEVDGWLAKRFFDHHLKMYSRSRRKAPVLWPIGTKSGSYLVWLYAHRVSADSLFQVLHDVVVPKVGVEDRELTRLRQEAGVNPSVSQRKAIDAQERLVGELRELREELEAVAPLWAPDLNDGIVIVLAPLWRLFAHHRAWSNELKRHWGKLAKGDYDWAQLAIHLWPERVVPKCAEDRSLAIAHGLEDVFWMQDPGDGDKWCPRSESTIPIDQLVAQRHNPAAAAALQRAAT